MVSYQVLSPSGWLAFFSDLEEDTPALRVRKQDVSEHCIFPIARWRVIQDESSELTEENQN